MFTLLSINSQQQKGRRQLSRLSAKPAARKYIQIMQIEHAIVLELRPYQARYYYSSSPTWQAEWKAKQRLLVFSLPEEHSLTSIRKGKRLIKFAISEHVPLLESERGETSLTCHTSSLGCAGESD